MNVPAGFRSPGRCSETQAALRCLGMSHLSRHAGSLVPLMIVRPRSGGAAGTAPLLARRLAHDEVRFLVAPALLKA